jgi:hypothetical protein
MVPRGAIFFMIAFISGWPSPAKSSMVGYHGRSDRLFSNQLIQLAAAAAIRSEGSVHSHVRRAIKAGASPEEVFHAIILLTSTIGFPSTSAALSWAHEANGAKE